MKVFKFGGASVCDADSIRNVGRVLQLFAPEKLVIVVSAMGKTTNAIEQMAGKAYAGLPWEADMQQLAESHLQTAHELNLDKQTIERLIANLRSNLVNYKDLPFDQYYDQTVPFGELLSSALLSSWLLANGQPTTLLAAGDLLVTDKTWREATVDMEASIMAIQKQVIPALANGHVLTQGFIGKYSSAFYTTLGREGSDYTGAILAHALDAEGLWIWKDVQGVLTGDPKEFSNMSLLEELSYYEAIEMTYYGATVIHPKTIQPLRMKQIPLHVRSFLQPEGKGTVVHMDHVERAYPPVLVLKKNQALLSITTRDYSFMVEEHLSQLYRIFSEHRVRINLLQTAALSLSVCVDFIPEKLKPLREALSVHFKVTENTGLQLLTVRHYNQEVLDRLLGNREPLLTQKSRHTIQMALPD